MTFLDIFSGIGGFRRGFELAGHTCIGHIEIDKYADLSYRAIHNVKENEFYASDIIMLKSNDIPRCDIWCFGFPCQDISIAGKCIGLSGRRSGLYYTVIDLIRGKPEADRPKYLIAENVRNLLSVNDGWDAFTVFSEMGNIGYALEWKVYNTKDFLLPQSRERIYILGSSYKHFGKEAERKILPVNCKDPLSSWQIQAECFKPVNAANGLKYNFVNLDINNGLFFTSHTRCLTTNYGTPDYKKYHTGIIEIPVSDDFENSRIRRFTPQECFRLQGFTNEDYLKAAAVCSDTQLYKQAGNSVSIPIVFEIAKQLLE